jgi:probable O-glycosylation ligase (exosortase A-associated)
MPLMRASTESSPSTERPSVAALPRPRKSAAQQTAQIPGTPLLFAGYLLLLVDSYVGLSRQFPIIRLTHIPTFLAWTLLLGAIAKVGFQVFWQYRQNQLMTAMVVFTGVSVLYAYVQMNAYEAFRVQLDNLILFVATMYLVDRRSRLKAFAIVAALAIIVLVLRNLDMLAAAERRSGFRAGYFMTDGNDFAWGLIVLLPMALFLLFDKQRLPLRLLGGGALVAVLLGVVGTQTRGGSLAIAAAGLYYLVFMAKRKMLGGVLLAMAVVVGLAVAPAEYVGRMESISTYDEDNSARGRLQAWGIALRMAADHPFGVGADNFNSAYGRVYLPRQASNMLSWGQNRWLSPHSIFFRMIGEYGFPGLLLLCSMIGTAVMGVLRVRRALSEQSSPPLPVVLPGLVAMGLIGYAVAGIFLGGLTYPHLFILCGLSASLRRQTELAIPGDVAAPQDAADRPAPLVAARTVPRARPSVHPALAQPEGRKWSATTPGRTPRAGRVQERPMASSRLTNLGARRPPVRGDR